MLGSRSILLRACVVGFAALTGCAVGPNFRRPTPPRENGYTPANDPTSTSSADGRAQRFVIGGRLAADWWRLFGSLKLDALLAHAFADNASLQAARASLERSRALLRAGAGVFFPQLDARAGTSYQRFNPAPGALPPSNFELFSLSGSVSYVLDIWGGQRRSVEALAAQVDVERYTLIGSWIMLSANLVNTVIARSGYIAQVEVTENTLKVQREQLRISEAQYRGGTVPYANVLSIRNLIASTSSTLPVLEQRADEATHLIASLTGRTPREDGVPSIALSELTLPTDVPVSVPSELVRQRPDILVAEAQLHAANASIGVATAAMLPSLTITGSYGWNARNVDDLFSGTSAVGNIGGSLTAPIFHGGQLYNQRKAAIYAREQAAAQYRQAVLGAFAQVADALRALEHDAMTVAARSEAVDASAQVLRLVTASYKAGVSTYLEVLVADTQYLQAALGVIEARAQRLQDTVQLYAALGGGWWNEPKAGAPRSH